MEYSGYGVATISRMLKNIGLFCKRALQKRPVFCKETYIFKHPTHRSHPIGQNLRIHGSRQMNKCQPTCCSVLQCVAVCCSVLQCVAVCRSVLQCVTHTHTHTDQQYYIYIYLQSHTNRALVQTNIYF